MVPADRLDSAEPLGCGHRRREGCAYCPICGVRYPTRHRRRGLLEWFFAPVEFMARIYAPISATPDLDVTSNLEALRSGDPDRMRAALGFLLELAPQARRIRPVILGLRNHADQDIALRARDVIAAMDALE